MYPNRSFAQSGGFPQDGYGEHPGGGFDAGARYAAAGPPPQAPPHSRPAVHPEYSQPATRLQRERMDGGARLSDDYYQARQPPVSFQETFALRDRADSGASSVRSAYAAAGSAAGRDHPRYAPDQQTLPRLAAQSPRDGYAATAPPMQAWGSTSLPPAAHHNHNPHDQQYQRNPAAPPPRLPPTSSTQSRYELDQEHPRDRQHPSTAHHHLHHEHPFAPAEPDWARAPPVSSAARAPAPSHHPHDTFAAHPQPPPELLAELETHRRSNAELARKVDSLREQLGEARSTVERQSSELEDLRKDREALAAAKTELEAAQTAKATVEAEMTAKRAELAEAWQAGETATTALDAASAELAAVQETLGNKTAELETAQAQAQATEAARAELEAKLAAVQQQLADKTAAEEQLASSQSQAAAAVSEAKAALEAELAAASERIAALEAAAASSAEQLATLQQTTDAARAAADEQAAALATAEARLASRTEQIRAFLQQIDPTSIKVMRASIERFGSRAADGEADAVTVESVGWLMELVRQPLLEMLRSTQALAEAQQAAALQDMSERLDSLLSDESDKRQEVQDKLEAYAKAIFCILESKDAEEATARIEALASETPSMRDSQSNMAVLRNLTEQIFQPRQERVELEERLRKTQHKATGAEETAKMQEQRAAQAQARLASLEAELTAMRASLEAEEARTAELSGELQVLNNERETALVQLQAAERDLGSLRDQAFMKEARMRDLEGELDVVRGAANMTESEARTDIARLMTAAKQLQQDKLELVEQNAALKRRVAEGEDQKRLREFERTLARQRREVQRLEALLTDVKGEVSDSLKEKIHALQDALVQAEQDRDQARAAEEQLRQETAYNNSSMRAQLQGKIKTIEMLQGKIKALMDQEAAGAVHEQEKNELRSKIRELQTTIEEKDAASEVLKQRLELAEAAQRAAAAAGAGVSAAQRHEAEVSEYRRKLEALRKTAQEDGEALRKLRAAHMKLEVQVQKLESEAGEREQLLKRLRSGLELVVRSYNTSLAGVWAAATSGGGHNLEELDAQGLLMLSDETEAVREWVLRCEGLDRQLKDKLQGLQEQVAGVPAEIAKAEARAGQAAQGLKDNYEKKLAQMKAKLLRKDQTLSSYDKDLAQLDEFRTKAETADASMAALREEAERLKAKLSGQRETVSTLTYQLQEQRQLCEALKKRRDSSGAAAHPKEHRHSMHDCVQIKDLETELTELKTKSSEELRQKTVLIETLKRKLKETSDKLVMAQTSRKTADSLRGGLSSTSVLSSTGGAGGKKMVEA